MPATPRNVPRTSPAYPRVSLPSRPALVATVGIALLAALAYAAASALTVFVVAAILAVILDPLVTRLTARGLPRSLAAAVVVMAVTLVTATVGLILGFKVGQEAVAFLNATPIWVRQASGWYAEAGIPPELRAVTDALLNDGASQLAEADLARAAVEVAASAIGMVTVVFGLLPFFLFFVLSDRPRTVRRLIGSIPRQWRGDAVAVAEIALRSLAAYLRGEGILMVFLSALTWLGLQALSLAIDPRIGDFALFLALIAAFSELLPILGPWVAAVPAVAFGLTLSPQAALAVAALYLVIAIVEGQILVPLVQGRQFAIHPAAVGVALVIGGAAAGLLGAILALPVLAAGLEIFRYIFRRSAGEAAPAAP